MDKNVVKHINLKYYFFSKTIHFTNKFIIYAKLHVWIRASTTLLHQPNHTIISLSYVVQIVTHGAHHLKTMYSKLLCQI